DLTVETGGWSTDEGAHTYTVAATDKAGNSASASVSYTVDDTPPSITLSAPSDGAWYTTATLPALDVTVTDNLDPSPTHTTADWSTAEGHHTVAITATDAAGNVAETSLSYTIDDTPPKVAITSPAEGAFYRSADLPSPAYTATDNLDNDLTVETGGWSTDEGAHTYTVAATDKAGNSASASVSYTVDDTPPEVTITWPADGHLTNGPQLTVEYMVDGTPHQEAKTLTEGQNTVIVQAVDQAGNRGADTITVTLDTQPPLVEIVSPSDGLLTNESEIAVSWRIDGHMQTTQTHCTLAEGPNLVVRSAIDAAGNRGADTVMVTLDTQPPEVEIVSPEDGYITEATQLRIFWTVDGVDQAADTLASLAEGENLIVRSALDDAGNRGADTITVVLAALTDIQVLSPANETLVLDTAVPVEVSYLGSRLDMSTLAVLLDGTNIRGQLAIDSAMAIGRVAECAGLIEKTLRLEPGLMYDTLEPGCVVGITVAGTPPPWGSGLHLALAGTGVELCTPDCGDDATCGSLISPKAVGATICVRSLSDGRTWTLTVTLWEDFESGGHRVAYARMVDGAITEGTHRLVASICDSGGTCVADTSAFTVDLPPSVRITIPPDNSYANRSPITVRYTVDGEPRNREVPLVEGLNLVVVDTTDEYGRRGADSIRVILDTIAPVVEITSPSDSSWTAHETVEVQWTVNGIPQTSHLIEGLYAEGPNTVIRHAYDEANNKGADTILVFRDTQAPVVEIQQPPEGFTTNVDSVVVLWSVDGVPQEHDTVEHLVSGDNLIVRQATDAVGNTGADTVLVNLDTEPPAVTILEPSDGYTTMEATVRVRWTIDGAEQTVDTIEPLTVGENTIVRSVSDQAGNTGSDTVQVFREACVALSDVVETWPNDTSFACLHLDNSTITTDGRLHVGELVLGAQTTLILGDTLYADTVIIGAGALLTHPPMQVINDAPVDERVVVVADVVSITEGGRIDVSERGCPKGYVPTGLSNGNSQSGGVHTGAVYETKATPYGDYREPILAGGGGSVPGSTSTGLAGGGVVRVAADSIWLDGSIVSCSDTLLTSTTDDYPAGAGGSIWLTCRAIGGSGTLDADSPPRGYYTSRRRGSGGRISLTATHIGSVLRNNCTALGHASGTIYLADSTGALLHFHGSTGSPIPVPEALSDTSLDVVLDYRGSAKIAGECRTRSITLADQAELDVDGQCPVRVFTAAERGKLELVDTLTADTIILPNLFVVQHKPSSVDTIRRLIVVTDYFRMLPGSRILANGRGMPSGWYPSGDTGIDRSTGASHGGVGAGESREPYGDYAMPMLPGAGGGGLTQDPDAGRGGGCIIVNASTAILDGLIEACGQGKSYSG
ncbi:MAG: hypothetical protein GF331_03385, partial [Chitinivibrionales bacterium]|nr:hypothetical protein [Chitinivibrionales bacterium]